MRFCFFVHTQSETPVHVYILQHNVLERIITFISAQTIHRWHSSQHVHAVRAIRGVVQSV